MYKRYKRFAINVSCYTMKSTVNSKCHLLKEGWILVASLIVFYSQSSACDLRLKNRCELPALNSLLCCVPSRPSLLHDVCHLVDRVCHRYDHHLFGNVLCFHGLSRIPFVILWELLSICSSLVLKFDALLDTPFSGRGIFAWIECSFNINEVEVAKLSHESSFPHYLLSSLLGSVLHFTFLAIYLSWRSAFRRTERPHEDHQGHYKITWAFTFRVFNFITVKV